jgi:putative nucleotidyltransferase with HDIG domain
VKRILFVDDEPRVLTGLERMLYPLRKEWTMVFASSGHAALELLSQSEFDVLITDMRMPVMSGMELLERVIEKHPQVVRMILSGTADQEFTLQSVSLAHQFLNKPCDANLLRSTVERALSLRVILEDPKLKSLVTGLRSLPSVPAVYVRLMESLRSPDSSAAEIGAIVSSDPSMTAKMLQLVNSAFFGIQRVIANPVEAVIYLGVETVRSLALTISVFSQFEDGNDSRFRIEEMSNHSTAVAQLARRIAQAMGLPKSSADDAFSGGLMHDLGKLVLACNFPERYREVMDETDTRSARQAEIRIFGSNHCAVGAYLLWLWGLPDVLTEIVACHHSSLDEKPAASATTAVQLADALIRGETELDGVLTHFEALQLAQHLPDWEQQAEEWRSRSTQLC